MSGPADLTRGCPVCGRAWQARGCEPGACKSDPDGLCVVCTARKLQAEREGKVDFTLCADCAAMMEEKRAAAPAGCPHLNTRTLSKDVIQCVDCMTTRRASGAVASVEHPLPWRWRGDDRTDWFLEDARGNAVILVDNSSPSPYVREVTALAPELEQLLAEWFTEWAVAKVAPNEDAVAELIANTSAALARLDAARKAGRGG